MKGWTIEQLKESGIIDPYHTDIEGVVYYSINGTDYCLCVNGPLRHRPIVVIIEYPSGMLEVGLDSDGFYPDEEEFYVYEIKQPPSTTD